MCKRWVIESILSIRFVNAQPPLGVSQKGFIRGDSSLRSNPITLYYTLLTEKVPGRLVYLLN